MKIFEAEAERKWIYYTIQPLIKNLSKLRSLMLKLENRKEKYAFTKDQMGNICCHQMKTGGAMIPCYDSILEVRTRTLI